MLELDSTKWAELRRINNAVNRLPYVTDIEQYGRDDFWTDMKTGAGDCDDFAIEKRKRLIAAGWPPESLLLAVCLDENGQGHAVLLIEATREGAWGTWVADNRRREVVPWESLPYTWIKRQARGASTWVSLAEANKTSDT